MPSFASLPDFEKFTEIFTGLYRATFGLRLGLFTYPVAVFLVHIHDSQNWVLVDAAGPENSPKLLSALSKHFALFPDHKLRYVAITHGHLDHTGSIPKLIEEYDDLKIILGQLELPFIADGAKYKNLSGDTCVYQVLRHIAPESKVTVERDKIICLEKGREDEFEFFKTLKPIFTVGHTPGSISYLHHSSGSILVGDCLMNIPTLPFLSSSIQMPVIFSTPNMKEAKESITKIANIEGVNHVFPAHDTSEKGVSIASIKSFAESLKG